MRAPAETFVGKVFGRYTVTGVESNQVVTARCSTCNRERRILVSMLNHYGGTKRCRCHVRAATTHGLSHSPEYRVWLSMIQRCTNPKRNGYGRYGGRGILVCDRWSAFENFLSDMGPRPSLQHSLDRIDGDGNYEPGNCRWATQVEQMRNMHRNVRLTFDGRTQCVRQWAAELGLSPYTIYSRIKRGFPPSQCLSAGALRRRTRTQSMEASP